MSKAELVGSNEEIENAIRKVHAGEISQLKTEEVLDLIRRRLAVIRLSGSSGEVALNSRGLAMLEK